MLIRWVSLCLARTFPCPCYPFCGWPCLPLLSLAFSPLHGKARRYEPLSFQVSLETGVPIAFGVLTVNSIEQAIERAGTKMGNKGCEAALSAIEMVGVLKALG